MVVINTGFWYQCPHRDECEYSDIRAGSNGDCWGAYDEVLAGMHYCPVAIDFSKDKPVLMGTPTFFM